MALKVLRYFRKSSLAFSVFSLVIIFINCALWLVTGDKSLFSSGGALVALIAALFLISYSVPMSEQDYALFLKIIKPLPHEEGVLAEILDAKTIENLESKRIDEGNTMLSAQATHVTWTVIGTLIAVYGQYIDKIIQAVCNVTA